MTTFAQLVDEVIGKLQGFTVSPDQVTHITADMTSGALAFTVDDVGQMGQGICEIDDERIYVKSTDTTSGTVTVSPFGRGYQSTTAAAHTNGTRVIMSPDWPRQTVKNEVNRSIAGLYPSLFAVKAASVITADGITYQFSQPTDSERIVDVRWLNTTTDGWQRAVQWEQENLAPSGFLTDRYVSIYDAIPAGSTIQVLYAAAPSPLVSNSDVYATVTGLPDSTSDLVVLATMARLAQFLDAGRMTTESASADALAQQRPIGSPTAIASQLYKQYAQRLADEQRSLITRYPVRAHKVR